ncbi:carboxypeptidase-like regulatory domain-containing protein [Sabulibacter ruber]|uniref:carboxypeptidase-like regulatory domain-containing protein n=1 Tax=Sabulibacter ruber TaxID=2811901 RepID=UPI001A964BA2|nr:carboxypeptidase-like regulatory domain-containing protein [Sabulibacter ruber]
MEPTQLTYPQFVANQVLKKDHLNDLFHYLDEQNRLTRTNLIGIGVVCGLEVKPNEALTQITIPQGCGVTSAGYLVALPEVVLKRSQPYELPEQLDYPPFYTSAVPRQPFPLWELLPSGGTQDLSAAFLRDKVVVIFVELQEENLKNCSPYSCDDRGSVIEVTYRYLLLDKSNADLLREAEQANGPSLEQLQNLQQAQDLLAEFKLKRFDVPVQNPGIFTTQEVIDRFRDLLTKATVERIKELLLKAYSLYQPLLSGVSDTALQQLGNSYTYAGDKLSLTNPLLYSYYYDFFSDLLEAYNEIRTRGLDITSICCPEEDLFPRHLFLGLATEDTTQTYSQYRHYFIPSPIFSHQQHLGTELRQLFQRLIRMVETFSVPFAARERRGTGIRITPSFLGKTDLSQKAIPFYFKVLDGNPPLYQLWSPQKTRQNKAKHNLSYHAASYPTPVEDFVLNPLEYDLEPYNFFRVEGHVGQPWLYALGRVLQLRHRYRLPFDVLVLKTGRNHKNVQDWRTHACSYQDLEALYLTLREELRCLLQREVAYFYKLRPDKRTVSTVTDVTGTRPAAVVSTLLNSKLSFFGNRANGLLYDENSLGALYEHAFLVNNPAATYSRVLALGQEPKVQAVLLLIQYLAEMAEFLELAPNLLQFNLKAFQKLNQNLVAYVSSLIRQLKEMLAQPASRNQENLWELEDIIDHLDVLFSACKKEAFSALLETYRKRLEEIQKQLLYGNYIRKHPGINHKAGVPVGGTFILVYAGEDGEEEPKPRQGRFLVRGQVVDANQNPLSGATALVKDTTFGATSNARGHFLLYAQMLPTTLTVSFAGFPTREIVVKEPDMPLLVILGEEPDPEETAEVPLGHVFVDFYLPYLCCSDCPPVQFTLEAPPQEEPADLSVDVSEPECDHTGRFFTVTLQISGGTAPYKVDDKPANPMPYPVQIPSGEGKTVTVRDSAGQEKAVQIPAHACEPEVERLRVEVSEPECNESGQQFSVILTISGGQTPYTVNGQPVTGTEHVETVPSGQGKDLEVKDASGQALNVQVNAHQCLPAEEPCDLPCDGKAELCWYPLWFPMPARGQVLSIEASAGLLKVVDTENNQTHEVDFASILREIFNQVPQEEFQERVQKLVDVLNDQMAQKIGNAETFILRYKPDERVLGVEHYVCHTFELTTKQTLRLGGDAFSLETRYNDQEWQISDLRRNAPATGKKFGCEEINKCRHTHKVLCEQEIPGDAVNLVVERQADGIVYKVETQEDFEQVLWLFGSGTPLFSQDPSGRFTTHTDESPVWFLGVRGDCYVVKEGSLLNG